MGGRGYIFACQFISYDFFFDLEEGGEENEEDDKDEGEYQ